MSDLAATNCGGGCSCNEGGCNSILWIIILLCCCGGNGGFCGGNNGCGGSNDCLWIILLLFCCGGCGGNGGGCFCSSEHPFHTGGRYCRSPCIILLFIPKTSLPVTGETFFALRAGFFPDS